MTKSTNRSDPPMRHENKETIGRPTEPTCGNVRSRGSSAVLIAHLLAPSRLSSCALMVFIRRRCSCLSFSWSAAARTKRTDSSTWGRQEQSPEPARLDQTSTPTQHIPKTERISIRAVEASVGRQGVNKPPTSQGSKQVTLSSSSSTSRGTNGYSV